MNSSRWLAVAFLALTPSTEAQNPLTLQLPDATASIEVVDENGRAIENAAVAISGTSGDDIATQARGVTASDGVFSGTFKSNGHIGVTVHKEGYYRSEVWKAYTYLDKPGNFERAFAAKRWEPSNPRLQILLRKITNPIPMFSRQVNKGIPAAGQPVGFDLSEGDFVEPYGRGKETDMIFRLEVEERSQHDHDYRIHVTFPQKGDGIKPFDASRHGAGSELRSPYNAPDNGFAEEWIAWRSRRPGGPETSNYDAEKHGYFFRVRTVVDPSGKIVTANYGKIYGDFMGFTYYLNPTPNDRNVEFDPKHNLFTDLKPLEQGMEP